MRNPIRRNKNIGKTQGGRVTDGKPSEKPSRIFSRHIWSRLSEEEVEEGYISERLREMLMLKAEESRVCKPLHYSNLLSDPGGDSV